MQSNIQQDTLTNKEKLLVYILCFIIPVIFGTLFYYKWKYTFPIKAKQANTYSIVIFILQAVTYIGYRLYSEV